MNQKLTLTIAILAGFIGGVLSQHVTVTPVYAETVLAKISAQGFKLVDKAGTLIGEINVGADGKIGITVRDTASGKMLFIDPVNAVTRTVKPN